MNFRLCSRNPDLLLPEIMEKRIEKITDFWGYRIDNLKELDRLTIFVTHRCNLRCLYCTGPHMNLKKDNLQLEKQLLKTDLSLDAFKEFLKNIMDRKKVSHIHFTGGEPTLIADLPKFIRLATDLGILCSITSNGTASPSSYRKIIESGLTEIRISLDSYSEKEFDQIVQRQGTFVKVIKSIKEITRLRDQTFPDSFLVLNVCVGQMNLGKIEKSLDFFINLQPNDIKFLVIAQEKEFVVNHQSQQLIKRLEKKLNIFPPEKFMLLKKKIQNLFNPNAIGLQDPETQKVMKHCFIPMTERTIDGKNYYPCSIYVRYYGEPIGEISEPFTIQQQKIMQFTRKHDCTKDPICKDFCTNCCKIFNQKTNQILSLDGLPIIRIEKEITKEDISATDAKITDLLSNDQDNNRPFIILKPYGELYRDEIIKIIRQCGLEIDMIDIIPKWERCASYVYCWPLTKQRIKIAIENGLAFKAIENGQAEIIRFKNNPSLEEIKKIRDEIRKSFPSKRFLIKTKESQRTIRLNAVHSPDPDDLLRENKILSYFITKYI